MEISKLLHEKYTSASPHEKIAMIADILHFTEQTVSGYEAAMDSLTKERDALKEKVERAAFLLKDATADNAKAKKAALFEIRKKLQISRDRLAAILSTAYFIGEHIHTADDQTVMIDALNNIIISVGMIAKEYEGIGLWDERDERISPIPF